MRQLAEHYHATDSIGAAPATLNQIHQAMSAEVARFHAVDNPDAPPLPASRIGRIVDDLLVATAPWAATLALLALVPVGTRRRLAHAL